MWIREKRQYTGGRAVREFVGTDEQVLEAGSPLKRAREIRAPVLLFHGDEDLNVSAKHSQAMAKALKRAKKSVEYVEYPEVAHGILRNTYRIDMLARIGAFVDARIGRPRGAGSAAASAAP